MRLARPLAIAGLSAGTLAYEVLLVRVFAVAHFHHFAFMAIGVAMLGFGAAGTWFAIARPRRPAIQPVRFALAALLATASLIASPAIALRIPLDPTRLAWDSAQWMRLLAVYVALATPFALGALANLIALALEPERTGVIYGAGFLGAAGGVAAGLVVLIWATPERAVALPAVLAAAGALAAQARQPAGAWGAVGLLAVGVVALIHPPWRLTITPYKGLPQAEAYPDARRVAERTSAVGWIVAVAAPSLRHAPGLSLAYRGIFPEQVGLFLDGEIVGALADWRPAPARELLGWLPSAMPYALGGRERVLVIGAGGGTDVWSATAHGAREITAVELSADLIRLVAQFGGAPAGTHVRWVAGDARGFVARAPQAFDVITIGAGGAFGASAAGVHGLSEDFLHTVEAYGAYLERLAPDGVLAITRWLATPPRETVRVILTAAAGLRRMGVSAERALLVARSWGTATVLVKPAGFTAADVAAIEAWAVERRFDLDWYPGATAPVTGFNALEEPTLFRAARAAAGGPDSAVAFAARYPFDVTPATDARPYPHSFLRARSLGAIVGGDRGAWLPFAEWGYVALVATLGQGLVAAALLLALPVALRRGTHQGTSRLWIVTYFSAIGLAYVGAEVAAIQQVGLLLGHPVYAVAAVLAAVLLGSGLGSAWSDRLPAGRARLVATLLGAVLMLYAAVLLNAVHAFQSAPAYVRAAIAVPLLAPLAFAMGMPFPLGLRFLAPDRAGLAWAWAANGFASVVAAPLAALVALELGSPALFAGSALGYAAAAVLARR